MEYYLNYKTIKLGTQLALHHHLEVVWVWDWACVNLVGTNKLNIWLTLPMCLPLKYHLILSPQLSLRGEFPVTSLIKEENFELGLQMVP